MNIGISNEATSDLIFFISELSSNELPDLLRRYYGYISDWQSHLHHTDSSYEDPKYSDDPHRHALIALSKESPKMEKIYKKVLSYTKKEKRCKNFRDRFEALKEVLAS